MDQGPDCGSENLDARLFSQFGYQLLCRARISSLKHVTCSEVGFLGKGALQDTAK